MNGTKYGVVFDFGGVITSSTMPLRVKELVLAKGLPWQAVLDGFAKHRLDYDRGDIGLVEFYDRIWEDAGLEVATEDRRAIERADGESWLYRNERTLVWMKALKASGHKLGILTNMPPDFVPLFKRHFADYLALADALVISGEEHVTKPAKAIYELAQERMGMAAAELVFIDDVEKNCEGARVAGWQAIRFASNERVEHDFDAL